MCLMVQGATILCANYQPSISGIIPFLLDGDEIHTSRQDWGHHFSKQEQWTIFGYAQCETSMWYGPLQVQAHTYIPPPTFPSFNACLLLPQKSLHSSLSSTNLRVQLPCITVHMTFGLLASLPNSCLQLWMGLSGMTFCRHLMAGGTSTLVSHVMGSFASPWTLASQPTNSLGRIGATHQSRLGVHAL